jgi:type IV secretion system protein VirB11
MTAAATPVSTPTRLAPIHLRTLEEEIRRAGLFDLLADETLTDLVVNEDGSVFASGFGGSRWCGQRVSSVVLEGLIGTIAGLHGQVVHEESPILEASLPIPVGGGRMRVEAILPPVSAAPILCLRRPPTRILTLEELEASGSVPGAARELLERAVLDRKTILISGGTSSGKTVLASALLNFLLEASPSERLVIVEEGARELMLPPASNVNRLLTSEAGGITMTRLVRAALRLNPDRIILGELRGAEAVDYVRASNTGHPGSVCTLHANSAPDALHRLHDLVTESGVAMPFSRVVSAVDRVVHVQRSGHLRFVETIFEPDPRAEPGQPAGRTLFHRRTLTAP